MSRLTWATLVMVNEMSLRGWGLIKERLARLFLLSVRLVGICSLVREASYGVNCTATTEGMRIDWVYLREDEDECNTTSQLAQASMDSPWQACRRLGLGTSLLRVRHRPLWSARSMHHVAEPVTQTPQVTALHRSRQPRLPESLLPTSHESATLAKTILI